MHVSALAQGSLKGKSTAPEMPKPVRPRIPELIRVGLPSDWKWICPSNGRTTAASCPSTAKRQGSGASSCPA
jgi:hypothetical protein